MGPPSYKLADKPHEDPSINYSYISTRNHRIQPLIRIKATFRYLGGPSKQPGLREHPKAEHHWLMLFGDLKMFELDVSFYRLSTIKP